MPNTGGQTRPFEVGREDGQFTDGVIDIEGDAGRRIACIALNRAVLVDDRRALPEIAKSFIA